VIELRRWADEIRRSEMEKARKRLRTLTQEQMEMVDAATAAIVSKLLHAPTVQIRLLGRDGDSAEVVGLVRKLLDLRDRGRVVSRGIDDRDEASMIAHDPS
jgi:glutamyl-tRNA reductase